MKRTIIFLTFFLLMLGGIPAFAQEVTTDLSNNQPHVGQPVQFVVTVRGARGAEMPQTLSVNGLRINLVGQSTQFEVRNMKMTSSVAYTYMVVPQNEGEFTIPAFDIKIEGRIFRTKPTQLSVGGWTQTPVTPSSPSTAAPAPFGNGGGNASSSTARPYFAELLVSKKKAYVGEVVPAELRFYFNSRYGGRVGERPTFGGEGFTVQKLSNANKRDAVVEGENYAVFSFQTSITPVKAGALEIPPAKLQAVLELPGNAPQGMSDFFGNFGGMFTDAQEVTLETKPVQLEVVALPKEGRPENFSGSIGKFTLEAAVSPKKVPAGEPVTLRATVSGQGNFDAMGAPVLTADEGWRSYPPSDKFESADAIHFTGEKTFEFPIIARQNQTKTPGLSFSYFDPSLEKYMTLTQEPFDVEVQGGVPQATPPPVAAASPLQATPTPAPTMPDVVAMAGGSSNWMPVFFRKEFLVANGALAFVWLAALGFFAARKFAGSTAGLKRARRRTAKNLLARVRHSDDDLFYGLAGTYLCARLEADGDAFTAAARINLSSLPDDLKSTLQRVLERQDESKYAAAAAAKPSSDERSQVVAALKELDARYEK